MSETLIHVGIEGAAYDVTVGSGILSELGKRVAETCGASRVFVVTETNVGPLYLNRIMTSFEEAGILATTHTYIAGEKNKTVDTWARICRAMANAGCDRDTVVVALGGGVTGDMAGFAAASFMRGVRLVQVPTSLLAMVDSSVGGKCGVDLPEGKNLVGAFLQPEFVLADVNCLDTLPAEQLKDACGEVIKHAVLADPPLLWRLEHYPITKGRTSKEMADIVAANVRIKRDVVVADEREQGLRQMLNLGHTIGHAIEAASDFKLGHGSCVAAGLCMIARASAVLGWCSPEAFARIERCVTAHGLPITSDVPADRLLELANRDKKHHGDSVNVVVPREIGSCEIRRISFDELRTLIELGQGR